MPERAAPPPPKKKNAIIKVVKALYSYTAAQHDEISFSEGEQLYILSEPEAGWYLARVGHPEKGTSGLIPSNYVEANTETIENPLHEAAKRGNLDFLSEGIGNKISPNGLDHAGCTPLHWAAAGGHLECVSKLLAQPNTKLDVQNKLGDTPLHQAAWKRQTEAVKMLLEAKASTDIRNNDGLTAFKLARDPETQALLRDKHMLSRTSTHCSDYIDDEAAEDSD